MRVIVNGEVREVGDETLFALVEASGANPAHAAAALNGELVPLARWPETPLKENDEVEILVFVGGG